MRVKQGSSGYRELINDNANFRNLWFGQVISLFGDWFTLIASATLLGELTGSGMSIGIFFVVRMLAPFLISPFAGVAADRYNRKWILIFSDIVRAIVVLGFLFIQSSEQLWLFYLLTFVQLAMHGVFYPTRNAILPDIVLPNEVGTANTITGTTWSVMLSLGAAIGGLVAGNWGAPLAFLTDSLTFIFSAIFISKVQYSPNHLSLSKKNVSSASREYLEGLHYLYKNRDILIVALHKSALTLTVVGGYEVIQVAIAKDLFVFGEGGGFTLGMMYAAVGLGSGFGPILARLFTGDSNKPLCRAILASYVMMAIGLIIASTVHSLTAILLGIFVRALGGGTLWVFSTQLLLNNTPEHIRGRIFATEYAMATLCMALSAGTTGWALEQITVGIPFLLTLMSALVFIPGTFWAIWISKFWKVREIEIT